MDYQMNPTPLLIQLTTFVIWSCLLYIFAAIVAKVAPKLHNWSRFWQTLLVLSFFPLLPIPASQVGELIPETLKNAFGGTQINEIEHSDFLIKDLGLIHQLDAVSWLFITLLIAGSMFCLYRFLSGLTAIKKLLNQASPVTDLSYFSPEHRCVIRQNNIKVYTCDAPISTFVFGFFNISLLIPSSVFTMPKRQFILLIEHELTHIKRQDPRAVIIFRCLASVCWFNPFLSLFEKHFLTSMELECDKQVITSFPQKKLDYAQALITSLKLNKQQETSQFSTSFSGTKYTKADLEQRIIAVMTPGFSVLYGFSYRVSLALCTFFLATFAIVANPIFPQGFLDETEQGIFPVQHSVISSDFDAINDFRGPKRHKGIDFVASIGTSVVATFSGKVLIANDTTLHKNYGKVVLIEHGDKIQSLYAHLNDFTVKSGQYVDAGQQIGTVGKTGRVTGPHLHFEVLNDGKRADPNNYLKLNQ